MEKQQKDELLTRIARHLMLQSSVIERTGLLDGKMGMAIFFFHYSRYNGNTIYEDFGGELINEIYEEIHVNTPVGFKEGLCGIGWGYKIVGFLDTFSFRVRKDTFVVLDNATVHRNHRIKELRPMKII